MTRSRKNQQNTLSFLRWMGMAMTLAIINGMAMGADDEPRKSEFECIGSFGESITASAVQGDIAYTGGGYALRAIDIHDPQHPRVLGWVRMAQPITGLEARGPAVYVAMNNGGGAWMVDATDPAHLRPVKEIGGGNRGTRVEKMGDFLYIYTGGKWGAPSYCVLRITDPLHPNEVNGGTARGFGYRSFVTNGKKLIAQRKTSEKDGAITLKVEDCTTAKPQEILTRTFKDGEVPGRLDLDSKTGEVWMGEPDMKNRVRVGKIDLVDEAWCVGNEDYDADEYYQFNKVKTANPRDEQAKRILTDIQNISIASFKVVDRVAYAVSAGWLSVIDCHKPELPVTLGRCRLPGDAITCAVENDTVYAGVAGKQLCVIDVSKPAAPVLISSCMLPKEPKAMAASGNRLFVADGEAGLLVLDTSNRAIIKTIGAYQTPEPCIDLATSGTLVYAMTRHTLFVLDALGNGAPALIGKLDYRSQDETDDDYDRFSVKRLGNALYLVQSHSMITDMETTLRIVDATNSATPRIVKVMHQNAFGPADNSTAQSKTTPAPPKPQIRATGWMLGLPAYSHSTAGTEWAMEFYDLSDPLNPVYVDGYYSLSACQQAVLYKDILYISHEHENTETGSLTILRRVGHSKVEKKL